MRRLLSIPVLVAGLLAGPLAGCASPVRPPVAREASAGPLAEAFVVVEPGTYNGGPARRVVSEHYLIETTVEDETLAESLGQLMEGALTQYQRLAPDVALTTQPMRCHIFASRPQWAGYTKENAGPDAEIYLQINRGGYTAGDRYVAYYIGDVGTWSVASHEGWHQFVARHFRRRPPPFLEEGLACMFEQVTWDNGGPGTGLPRWNLSVNGQREAGLRKTVRREGLLPLERLCTMHAGQVVNTSGAQIEGFYAQCWAFARFLWDGQGRRYRPALQAMLHDLAVGEAASVSGREGRQGGVPWDPADVRPLLEHYLGKSLPEIDREYEAYMRRLASVTAPPDFEN